MKECATNIVCTRETSASCGDFKRPSVGRRFGREDNKAEGTDQRDNRQTEK